MAAQGALEHIKPSRARFMRVLAVCSALWVAPIALLTAIFGRGSVFVTEAAFFSQAAVVTFGGAYSVLAYIAQQAVEVYGWLQPGEMLDGLGLAETTPGPLIMVVQFVGFLGGYRFPGALSPLAGGVLGSVVTVWVTFVPCFMWIFLGGPYVESLRGNKAARAALSAITAAVVGAVLNLSLWFAVHVIFRSVGEQHVGPLRLLVPDLATFEPAFGRSLGGGDDRDVLVQSGHAQDALGLRTARRHLAAYAGLKKKSQQFSVDAAQLCRRVGRAAAGSLQLAHDARRAS